ncbi:uncharacterized protein LOC144133026 isoform X2 [Amblyomma americanum]
MTEAVPSKQKMGTKYCCVVDCHNSAKNTKGRDPPVRMYGFPGKWYEKERRQAWISAVRRINPDGTKWLPKAHTRICSAHFEGNCKSDISQHSSYIPTIFPPVYRKKARDQKRARRWQRRFSQEISSTQLDGGEKRPSQNTAEPETSIKDELHCGPSIMDFNDESLEASTAVPSPNSTVNRRMGDFRNANYTSLSDKWHRGINSSCAH